MQVFDIPAKTLCIISDRPLETILNDDNIQMLRTYQRLTFIIAESAVDEYRYKHKGGHYYFRPFKDIAEMVPLHDVTICVGISPLQAKISQKPNQKLFYGKLYDDLVEFGKEPKKEPVATTPKEEVKIMPKIESKPIDKIFQPKVETKTEPEVKTRGRRAK